MYATAGATSAGPSHLPRRGRLTGKPPVAPQSRPGVEEAQALGFDAQGHDGPFRGRRLPGTESATTTSGPLQPPSSCPKASRSEPRYSVSSQRK